MKIFIAGSKSIKKLDPIVEKQMKSISEKRYDVLVGDCYGVDSSVQKFYCSLNYRNITIYASNGKARNNIGNYSVKSVSAKNLTGFDFYKQKDIAMANDANCGLMIWDGQSRGTLNNTINLLSQNKPVLLYLNLEQKMFLIKTIDGLSKIISQYCPSAFSTFKNLGCNQILSTSI